MKIIDIRYHSGMMSTNTFKLPVARKNDIYKYFQPPNHSSLLELLLKNVYKYFQLPNHGSLLELQLKKIYEYFQPPRPYSCLVNICGITHSCMLVCTFKNLVILFHRQEYQLQP